MELDSNLLLTAEKLRLEPGLIQGTKFRGTYAIKRVDSQTYLVVDERQGRVLSEFTQLKTVPEVLEACIRKRSCPALREFYDLILKAHRAGVLRSEELGAAGPAAVLRPPVRWFLPLPASFALGAAMAGLAALVGVALFRAPVLSGRALDLLTGWAATCAALSLGHILAAAVLHRAERVIYDPHIDWWSLAPHLTFDFGDSCLTSGRERAALHAIQFAPLAFTTAAGLWFMARWTGVPLAAALLACCPVGGSPVRALLHLMRRVPQIDTDTTPLFQVRLVLGEQWAAALRHFDRRVAAVQVGLALLWVAAVGVTACRGLHLDFGLVFFDWSVWKKMLPAIGVALVGVLLWWAANAVQYEIADAIEAAWRRWTVKWRRWLAGQPPLADSADADMLIRRNPLLRRLTPEAQMELAQHARPLTLKAWRRIAGFDQEPPYVGLIISGTATIDRRSKSGRKHRLMRVMEGDLFGVHDLVDREFASLEIRTNTPLHALVFDRAEFTRLVIDSLTAKVVRDYVDKHLFLQRAAPMCAEWRPAAVARFAELAVTASHSAGGKIISLGQEIGSLYVLAEGTARASLGKKTLGRIEPGDFFGETSLLQSSAATADVESREDGRYLAVNRIEFIRFMSRNHHVALQMERLCSKRLGHPVFPLNDSA